MEKVLMIVCGEKLLCEEFDRLLKFRFKIIEVIVEVCEFGDLKENVEYYVVCEE